MPVVSTVGKGIGWGNHPEWSRVTNAGIFHVPAKDGSFDCHFHDCDEYWILFAGRGVVVSEGKHYEVGVGDCVATGMGHHHDFPQVFEPVEAVYFETTLERQKCLGHLWNHTYGKAQPRPERV